MTWESKLLPRESECHDEGETCRQLGFEYAQGYFYGRPLQIGVFAPPEAVVSRNGLSKKVISALLRLEKWNAKIFAVFESFV
jgi:c-di-GMP-related signal transduction protein